MPEPLWESILAVSIAFTFIVGGLGIGAYCAWALFMMWREAP